MFLKTQLTAFSKTKGNSAKQKRLRRYHLTKPTTKNNSKIRCVSLFPQVFLLLFSKQMDICKCSCLHKLVITVSRQRASFMIPSSHQSARSVETEATDCLRPAQKNHAAENMHVTAYIEMVR